MSKKEVAIADRAKREKVTKGRAEGVGSVVGEVWKDIGGNQYDTLVMPIEKIVGEQTRRK